MVRDESAATGSDPVDIRVLGPVALRRDGVDVNVGHTRQRAVLAMLAIRVGALTSGRWLVEELWQHRPPQRARDTLYSYLSRLRKLFEGTEVGIERRSGGYLLNAEPDVVDMYRFRGLVARARATGEIADWDAALELWRGEPFADFDVPYLNRVRTTLDVEYFGAMLDRNDALLRHGQHARALPLVRELVGQHPWDERLAGQLLLALHRCGRSSEALDHYRDLATRLVDERGVEPGPDLADLHRAILTEDPRLAVGPPPAGRAAAGPRHLPGDVRGFTGRREQLRELDGLLARPREATPLAVVTGPAGVGKTSLAVHWGHKVAARFPDGQLYVNLRGFDPSGKPVEPGDAVMVFLYGLGVPPGRVPAEAEARFALYRSLTADRSVLILLDNARDADHVRPLLPTGRDCAVVVTSRRDLTGLVVTDGAVPVPVPVFTEAEARSYLHHRIDAERIDADRPAVTAILERCDGLPLALSVVAARALVRRSKPLSWIAGGLRDREGGLDGFGGDDAASDLRAVLSWSYRDLSRDPARMFRLLSLHPSYGLSTAAAASVAGLPLDRAEAALRSLTRANLLIEQRPGRFTYHDLLRAYARELVRAAETAEHDAAIHRMLDHYLHTADAADALFRPDRDPVRLPPPHPDVILQGLSTKAEALEWFTVEELTVIHATSVAAREGRHRHVHQLVRSVEKYLERFGRWVAWLTLQLRARDAARADGDHSALAHVLCLVGHGALERGRYAEAHANLTQALELYEALSDEPQQAWVHLGFTMLLNREGRHEEAVEHGLSALKLYRHLNHRDGTSLALNNLGWTHGHLGRYPEALEFCRQALALVTEAGDRRSTAHTLDSLAFIHRRLGNRAESVEFSERAIAMCTRLGEDTHTARIVRNLGDAYAEWGQDGPAAELHRRAAALLVAQDRAAPFDVREDREQFPDDRAPADFFGG